MFFKEDLHVVTLHELDEVVELEGLLFGVVLLHEVMVFDDVGVVQVLCQDELSIHLLHRLFSQTGVVIDLTRFVYELTLYANQSDLEDVSLSAAAKLLELSYLDRLYFL